MKVNPYAPSEKVFENAFGSVLDTSNAKSINNINSTNENDNSVKNTSFADVLKSSLDDINSQQIKADNLNDSFTKGEEGIDITDVMLATAEANTSLQYAVQIRNKLVDAYQEIIKMQI